MSKRLRCAIYTRKSSDEGLDQAFNSLDAQREAGMAYIKSQTSEGWKLIPTCYDDGGHSGGTMERPALQQLLGDIDAGRIDVVVVYKIDRLTRSLADFARIVERFDARAVSFVSVTQAFNTTSSMGRLTLNVLLSFAQFEREVTGERIRDKIAASKAKGMWMGGNVPLGYDLPAPGTRTLQVNAGEAAVVREIFDRYLALGSVHALQRVLVALSICSKRRITVAGRIIGGTAFSRGALFHMLRNPVYRGMITHKGEVHAGEHDAIIDEALFERVQQRLDANRRRHHAERQVQVARAPLTAKLFDACGEPMSPAFSRGRSERLYRYYVSTSLQQGGKPKPDGVIRRLPAPAIERIVADAFDRWLGASEQLHAQVRAVRLNDTGLTFDISHDASADIAARLQSGERLVHTSASASTVHLTLGLPLRGGRRLVIAGAASAARRDPTLIAALRKAHRMVPRDRSGRPLITAAPVSPYDRRIQRLVFLAPDLQRDIMAGRQPPMLNLETLMKMTIPLIWSAQRKALGWPAYDPVMANTLPVRVD